MKAGESGGRACMSAQRRPEYEENGETDASADGVEEHSSRHLPRQHSDVKRGCGVGELCGRPVQVLAQYGAEKVEDLAVHQVEGNGR